MLAQLPPRLAKEQIGDITVVKINQPEILDDSDIQRITARLHQLVGQLDRGQLVLNLEPVHRLSTRFAASFLALDRRVRTGGGRMVLCGVQNGLQEILTLLKVPRSIQICRDEEEALQAF